MSHPKVRLKALNKKHLYYKYPGNDNPQPVFMFFNYRTGECWFDYLAKNGAVLPDDEWDGGPADEVFYWPVPSEAMNSELCALFKEVLPLLRDIIKAKSLREKKLILAEVHKYIDQHQPQTYRVLDVEEYLTPLEVVHNHKFKADDWREIAEDNEVILEGDVEGFIDEILSHVTPFEDQVHA